MLSIYDLKDKQALCFLIFILVCFFSPFLFFGKIFLNGDATYYAYPVAYFFHNYLGNAVNGFVFSGYPVTAAFQIGFFNPLYNIFFYLFDFVFAYHFLLFVDFCGAAIFAYLFARQIGVSVYGAVIVSLSYTFSQFSMAWLAVVSVANAVFLLPAIMYFVAKIVRGKYWNTLPLGFVIGLSFLGTHYQFIVIALIGVGAYLLYEIIVRWQKNRTLFLNIRPALFFCVALILAFVVALPQALHSVSLFAVSTRSEILVYQSAWYSDIFRYFIPTFYIPNISLTEFRPYIGIVVLFFAVVAVFAQMKKSLPKAGLFFLLFFVVCFILSLKYSPLLFLVKNMPFLKYFVEQSRWLYIGNFALIVVAGFGYDYFVNHVSANFQIRSRSVVKRFLYTFIGVIIVLNAAIYLFGGRITDTVKLYFDENMYENTIKLPIEHYHGIIEIMAEKVFYNVTFSNPNIWILIVSIAGLYGLLFLGHKKKLFQNSMILLVVFSMTLVSAQTVNLGDRSLLEGGSKAGDFIKSQGVSVYDYRVFGFLVPFAQYQNITALHPEEEGQSLIFSREALMGNTNIFSEIPIVGGYEPLAFRRYQNIVAYLENTVERTGTEEKIESFKTKMPILSMMNVRYVLSPYQIQSPQLKPVWTDMVTEFDVPLYLYENVEVLPRVYVANDTVFLKENAEQESFDTVTRRSVDFAKTTFIECDDCGGVNMGQDNIASTSILRQNSYGVEMSFSSAEPKWLVYSNQAVPGWEANIDGMPVKIYYANHAYQAVLVPPGEHMIKFSYSKWPKIFQ